MDFMTQNKQKRAISQPDKKSASLTARRSFVAASLKFGGVGQNFVKVKHAGRTHLQYALTEFFASKQKICLLRPAPISGRRKDIKKEKHHSQLRFERHFK